MKIASLVRSLVAFAGVLGCLTPRPALAATVIGFSSPTHGIGCIYAHFENEMPNLRCDVRGGVVPLPPQPKDCEFDWGQGFWMSRTGKATIVCAGDTALGAQKVVPYGTTWRHDGFACASSSNGMRCTNASRHGFFISRGEAYRF